MAITKYQIFVSSTFEDLRIEREMAIKAILEMGHIPVGMEMFSAADEEQWQIIARNIRESDYYCVILAHRFGSELDGISYTQKEYTYAVSCGVPVLGFVIDDESSWPAEMIDKGESASRLIEFKSIVKQKPVSFWKTAEDLYGRLSIALQKQMTANPRDGWVRASSVVGPEVTAELSRLSSENSRLRVEIADLNRQIVDDRALEVRNGYEDLQRRTAELHYKESSQDKEWAEGEITYSRCFLTLAPRFATETNITELAKELCMYLVPDGSQKWHTVAWNQMRDLVADFMALDLVEPSKRKHAVSDTDDYWTLTPFGHEVHKYARRLLLDMRVGSAPDGAEDPDSEETSISIENATPRSSTSPDSDPAQEPEKSASK